MEHVVFFPSSDGSPAFRRLPSVEEAVRLVEHLRNVEGVDQVSVHALTEVPLAFRAYYRVEVPLPDAAPVEPVEAPAEAEVEVPVEAEPMVPVVSGVAVVATAPADPADIAVQPEQVPALALVENVPAQGGEPEPALSTSNGRVGQGKDGATSLGFFA